MNLVEMNVLLFWVSLNACHEVRWITQEIVRIHVPDQLAQQGAANTAFTLIISPDLILSTGSTVGDVHLDIGTICYKITNFASERVMLAITGPMDKPYGPVAIFSGNSMKDAQHWRDTNSGAYRNKRAKNIA